MSERAVTPGASATSAIFRDAVRPSDAEAVSEIVRSTGFFTQAEVDMATELVEERLERGLASGYHFLFDDRAAPPAAYTCFGPIDCTESSFDLYWIAVHASARGLGLGREILAATEAEIARLGGRRVWVETSSRAQYEPTRAFYRACGYREAGRLDDFYAEGDGKVFFVKVLDGAAGRAIG